MFEIIGGGARTVGRAALSKTLRRLGLGLACRALDLLSEHAEPPGKLTMPSSTLMLYLLCLY